jgi:chromosome segregation ATPase
MMAEYPASGPRDALRATITNQDDTAAFVALSAAFRWVETILAEEVPDRATAVRRVIALANALAAGASLGDSVSALQRHADPGIPMERRIAAAVAALADVARHIDALRADVDRLEAADATLAALLAEAAALAARQEELHRRQALAADLEMLERDREAVEYEIDALETVTAREEALAETIRRFASLACQYLPALRADTQAARDAVTRGLADLRAAVVAKETAEAEARLISERVRSARADLADAERRYEDLAAEHRSLLAPLVAHHAADAALASALPNLVDRPDAGQVRVALDAIERQLVAVDDILRAVLAEHAIQNQKERAIQQ